jgi:quercetin dioxygenase-like cupin family protein
MASSGDGIGARVKQLRENRHMEPADLAGEVGESTEYILRLESGQFRPPVAMLLSLARALKVDSMLLLGEPEPVPSERRHKEAVRKRTKNYAYQVLAPELIQKYLKSFLVTIEPDADLEGPGYQHQGEEFHYVLKGEVTVSVGEEVHHLKKGEALYFNSEEVHQLSNPGSDPCEILVVLYTP